MPETLAAMPEAGAASGVGVSAFFFWPKANEAMKSRKSSEFVFISSKVILQATNNLKQDKKGLQEWISKVFSNLPDINPNKYAS
jgi:hypothetical protein